MIIKGSAGSARKLYPFVRSKIVAPNNVVIMLPDNSADTK
ncbi:unnamed protein product [marine sediment metagenome]|uniref:Uncharacterized protein n=1 Tax=marine sediment metagenome TaxID=412755 RepID=X0V542_9ZZZZ